MKTFAAAAALAVVALAFVAGMTIGPKDDTATTANGDKQYMLLLYANNTPERIENRADVTPEAYAAIVDEYRKWGIRMAEQGRLVGAEKLKEDALTLAANGGILREGLPDGRVLEGYFLILASSFEHARELAQTHPHLKYGGEIDVRPLDLHD